MIHCGNVIKSFENKTVLRGINLDIYKGQIFGLLGPSGAGKTTLIKILTGQLEFDSGEVRVFEKELNKLTGEDKKKIGIMSESFGVYERLSCVDNLKIYADIYGIPYTKVNEILEYVGLGNARKKQLQTYQKEWKQGCDWQGYLCIIPKLFFLMSRQVDWTQCL